MHKIPNLDSFLEESNNIENVWDEKSLKQARKAWNYLIKEDKLTIENIQHAHGILMKNHLPEETCGHFRQQAVWIGGREAVKWPVIQPIMENLCHTFNLKNKTEDDIKKDHINFEACHPFVDGNGRMGRLILNWQRIKNNLPLLVIYNEEKWDYYKWFK